MSEHHYTGVGIRRSHRKSRLGCAGCKRRHIKCDETRPQCGNCIRQAVPCNYPEAARSPPPGESLHTPVATPEATLAIEWSAVTAELMHHWTTSTCFTFTDDSTLQTFMQIDAPRIAFVNEHVLHMILAISALHLARLKPAQEKLYTDHANSHYQAGLRIMIPLLPGLNTENCHSTFLFATFCNGYSLARGPQPGDYLLFSDNDPAECSVLFHGLIPLLQSYSTTLMSGPLAPMMGSGVTVALHASTSLSSTDNEQLSHLHHLIQSESESESESTEDSSAIDAAMDHLRRLFSSRYSSDGQRCKPTFHHIGIWLWNCSAGFTKLLEHRSPAALTIVAYACVILKDFSPIWVMDGWIPHLLKGVHGSLPPRCHPWIQWPIQQIGWIPS
ncbi:hypothetical protein P280DRAFT_394773 [Massarina eburnea CBS 473.64]|uniref:Zn(2)-C6 fungal-type domain-containing protein n=1 Tax=Massarina eburnea CBS 473.64 TaxID=1395130 RepID=A0A6A6S9H2_9PLEO|nr:hypothetical protein P280DRAFT_394773 [Massarina eburnea CBS 473.64]